MDVAIADLLSLILLLSQNYWERVVESDVLEHFRNAFVKESLHRGFLGGMHF